MFFSFFDGSTVINSKKIASLEVVARFNDPERKRVDFKHLEESHIVRITLDSPTMFESSPLSEKQARELLSSIVEELEGSE